MLFLQLPQTVIEAILYEVPAADLLPCLLVNKYLNEIVTASMRLLLKRQLANLGAEINPFSSFSTSECLHILKESTRNWSNLIPSFTYAVHMPHEAAGVGSKEGVVFCVRKDGKGVSCMQLSYIQHNRVIEEGKTSASMPVWRYFDLCERDLINLNLCLYEHDLLAFVTSTLDLTGGNTLPEFSIHIQLYRFSNFSPHPRASINDIVVMKSPVQRPHVVIDIVGRHLVLIVRLSLLQPHSHLRGAYVFVYNWQTGTLLMEFTAPMLSYESVVFLDEHLILLPNAVDERLDIFRIPTEPNGNTQHVPIVALQLPTLRYGLRFLRTKANHGTNPIAKDSWSEMHRRYTEATGTSCQYSPNENRAESTLPNGSIPLRLDSFHSHKPFIMRGEDALCVFNFATGSFQVVRTPNGVVQHQERVHELFIMHVHRKALLRAAEKYAPRPPTLSRRSIRQGPWASIVEPVRNQTTHPSPSLSSPTSAGNNNIPQPSIIGQNSATVHPHATLESRVARRTPIPAISVAWKIWGSPQITRWFKTDYAGNTVSVGERCLRLAYEIRRTVPGMPIPYYMFDFNKYLCWNPPLPHHRWDRSDPSAEHSGTDDLHERGMRGLSVDRTPGQGEGSMDGIEEVNGLTNLAPASASASGGSEDGALPQRKEYGLANMKIDSLESAEFLPPIQSGLPYNFTSPDDTVGMVNWDSIMVDEERLIGLCRNGNSVIHTVEIHHFG